MYAIKESIIYEKKKKIKKIMRSITKANHSFNYDNTLAPCSRYQKIDIRVGFIVRARRCSNIWCIYAIWHLDTVAATARVTIKSTSIKY